MTRSILGSKGDAHTTHKELEFLLNLGNFADERHTTDREELLTGYLKGLSKRVNMDGMDRKQIERQAYLMLEMIED